MIVPAHKPEDNSGVNRMTIRKNTHKTHKNAIKNTRSGRRGAKNIFLPSLSICPNDTNHTERVLAKSLDPHSRLAKLRRYIPPKRLMMKLTQNATILSPTFSLSANERRFRSTPGKRITRYTRKNNQKRSKNIVNASLIQVGL